MKRHSFLLLAGAGGFLLLFSLACAAPALRLFATPTPTPSLTPTHTYTPTFTSTFTPTPLPPVQIIPCPFEGYAPAICYDAKTLRQLLPEGEELRTGIEYPVEFSHTEPVSFSFGWCALTREILEQNLASIVFVFSIDGYSYADVLSHGYYTLEDNQFPSGEVSCYGIAGVLQGWKVGENHIVKIGLEITDSIDGWYQYEPAQAVYSYFLKPLYPTPTSTFTPTRTPTRTSVPVYYTATPPCAETVSLRIQNDTGGYISLNLRGVAKYSFWLGPGYHTLQVCPGSYSFTASGCGGATTSGTMNAGEEHRFFCTSTP